LLPRCRSAVQRQRGAAIPRLPMPPGVPPSPPGEPRAQSPSRVRPGLRLLVATLFVFACRLAPHRESGYPASGPSVSDQGDQGPMTGLLLKILVPFLLFWLLAGLVLLAWRLWRRRPALAAMASVAVVAAGPFLFRSKWLALAALAALLIAPLALRRRR